MTRPARTRTALLAAFAAAAGLVAAPSALATFPGENGKLLYQRDSKIWTSDPDGTGERAVTHTNGESGTWSPDGRSIAFDVTLQPDDPATGIWTVNRDGTKRTKLDVVPEEDFPTNPAWTRDGRSILFNGSAYLPSPPWPQYAVGTGIRAIDRDGSNERWLLLDSAGYSSNTGAPAPSPTSDVVAFVSGSGASFSGRIGFYDPSSGRTEWYLPSWPSEHPCSSRSSHDPCALGIGKLSWSPDGTRLLFASDCNVGLPYDPAPCPGEPARMSILDVDDFERRTLEVAGRDPVWSPDGRRIAFTRELGKPFEELEPGEVWDPAITVFVMDADGTDVQPIGLGAEPDWQAVPRPSAPPKPSAPPAPPGPPGPPAAPTGPPPHVPHPPKAPDRPGPPSVLAPGTGGGAPTTGGPTEAQPRGAVTKVRTTVRAPLRARLGKPFRLVVRFSRPLETLVRVQERRGNVFVTILRKTVRGTRIAFTLRPRKGIQTFRIVHAEGSKIVRVRIRPAAG